MALKKSELYASLWKSCDELRGGMDASQYKDYVLVLLFVKYVSDKAASRKNYLLEVPKGGRFTDMVAAKNQKDIGEKLNKVVAKLAEANELRGVIDVADWNEPEKLGKGQEMVDKLSKLVGIFESLDFGGNRADGDDLLGDAYEYLMRHFATESGKSKGQFYTPAEVSRIMARVIGLGSARSATQSIHDPTCGSGSLLLKAHDEAKHATGLDLALYGQEMDNATRALARMNLILHDCPTAEVEQGNTLASPQFTDPKTGALKTFDFVVANPPFSNKTWSNGVKPAEDTYKRFALGVPPKKNGDYAFLLHVLACLKSTGKGAIILPHGVLFRGNAEADLRREIVKRGYIKGIIGLPPNLFYGTGIPACIVVLDKEGASARKGIFMIDASKGFIKDGPKNRLREQDIHKIVDAFTRQVEISRFSRMVPLAEITDPKNDFNLNIPRYIDSSEPEDVQDIDGHLRGGIPDRDLDALERYWQVIPGVRAALFRSAGRPGYSELAVAPAEVKAKIYGHPEFAAWSAHIDALLEKWRKKAERKLRAIAKGDRPKALIEEISEELLATFTDASLIDAYDVYQRLMDYWADAMQDDAHLITAEGWSDAARPRLLADKKSKEKPDLVVGKQRFKTDVLPPALVVARYFSTEQAALDTLDGEAAALEEQMKDLAEEHGGEDGLLAEVVNEKGNITKGAVAARLKEIEGDTEFDDERKVLSEYRALLAKSADVGTKADGARTALAKLVAHRCGNLTDDDARNIVVTDKWTAAIARSVRGEVERMSLRLADRIRELAYRYSRSLPDLARDVAKLAQRVDTHLKNMGATWS